MSAGKNIRGNEEDPPQVILTTPSVGTKPSKEPSNSFIGRQPSRLHRRLHRQSTSQRSDAPEKHVRLADPNFLPHQPGSSSSDVYLGSYGKSPRTSRSHSRSRSRLSLPESSQTPDGSPLASPRVSLSTTHLDHLLENLDIELEDYGVEEFRDGFFDAAFFKPLKEDTSELLRLANLTLPTALMKHHPLSIAAFIPKQLHEMQGAFQKVANTRAGIKLFKSFSAFFIAYVLCLIPIIGDWLGPRNYVMPLSAIINHPGRPVGAQLDGALFTVLGTASGLGWGAFALWVSASTGPAKNGYGGILATFLIIFMAAMAALRSYFIRSYQFVLMAGTSVLFTCLSHTTETVDWRKLYDWGIPLLFGQAIALVVCCSVFPDGGARPLAVSLHAAFEVMEKGLEIPRPDSTKIRRDLAWTFANLSQAYRDLTIDISVTRFDPSDIRTLRNLMQAVIRSLLSLKSETELFEIFAQEEQQVQVSGPVNVDIAGNAVPPLKRAADEVATTFVVNRLAQPTLDLLSSMRSALGSCDAVLMDMSGYRKYLGPGSEVSSDIVKALLQIRGAMMKFDEEDDSLTEHPNLPDTFSNNQELVKLFLFVNPIRQACTTVEALLVKVNEMQQQHRGWRVFLPCYPFSKALQRTNQQVRHDRGGATAGFFFWTQKQLTRQLQQMQKSTYRPMSRYNTGAVRLDQQNSLDEHEVAIEAVSENQTKLRYKIWLVLHGLQGFEMRFSLKVVIATSLLAVPAWLQQSRGWFNEYESWWAVIFLWVMMHPRVGGNLQDLVTRSLAAILGAAWAAFAYAARNGNPYVMAVFAAIFMIPAMYRFTQSSHPRSGIVGCISFTVVSLSAYNNPDLHSISQLAWTRGTAFVVGVTSAVMMNWILWPFVARHELKKAISAMMLHMAIVYRGVVAKYIYYQDGEEPSIEDVTQSELLEGRLREGFVRMRQLMALTRHEIRLRGPFDPRPYSALIANCESFFDHLVEVRQSSLFFKPNFLGNSGYASETLLPFRRDAVASILMNLYVLAGALRGNRKVPRYLPSATAARRRLLARMAELEMERRSEKKNGADSDFPRQGRGAGRKFAEVYQYAYSQALTECVEQLEELTKYTRTICGEVGFDPIT